MSPGSGEAAALGSDDASRPQLLLDFDDFRALLEELSPNISMEGMFFATEEPHPAGTEVDLDVRLAGGSVLVGRGEVVWSSAAGDGRAAGLGIRLDEVDDEGRTLIQRIVEVRTQAGRDTFQLERGDDDPSSSVAAAPAPAPPAEADGDSVELKAELEQGREELEQLRAELETAQAAESELRVQLSDALAREEEAIAARDQLSEQLHGVEESNRSDRARLEEALLDKLSLEHQIGEKDEVLARFQESTGHAAADRDRLEGDKRALETRLQELEGSIEEGESRRDALRKELAEIREELETRSLELEAAHETRAELQEEIDRSRAEVDTTRAQLDEESQRAEEARREHGRLESELAEARSRVETLESETEALRDEAETAESARGELETELEAEKKAALKARKLAKRVRGEHEALQEDLAAALARVEELEAGLAAEVVAEPVDEGDETSEDDVVEHEPAEEAEVESPEAESVDDEGELEQPDDKRQGTGLWASLAESFGRSRDAEEDEAPTEA